MDEDLQRLYGACACERNQYTIELPRVSRSLASVFFDNSAQSRRPQASPVTAWLRVPLDFFHSATIARFDDESHATIRRTFFQQPKTTSSSSTRRQFCGYCGTHLTAFDESQELDAKIIDVTLGSLLDESLAALEDLDILPPVDEVSLSAGQSTADGTVGGGSIDDDSHIAVTAIQEARNEGAASKQLQQSNAGNRSAISQYMQHRGIPYFEEMIENSSLGRIRRQRGGQASNNGRTVIEWEVIEFEGDEDMTEAPSSGGTAKRVKLDS